MHGVAGRAAIVAIEIGGAVRRHGVAGVAAIVAIEVCAMVVIVRGEVNI
jgi:hypothetical protein